MSETPPATELRRSPHGRATCQSLGHSYRHGQTHPATSSPRHVTKKRMLLHDPRRRIPGGRPSPETSGSFAMRLISDYACLRYVGRKTNKRSYPGLFPAPHFWGNAGPHWSPGRDAMSLSAANSTQPTFSTESADFMDVRWATSRNTFGGAGDICRLGSAGKRRAAASWPRAQAEFSPGRCQALCRR